MSAGLVTTYRNILTKAQLEVILATMQDEIDGLVAIGMAQINKHDRVNGVRGHLLLKLTYEYLILSSAGRTSDSRTVSRADDDL